MNEKIKIMIEAEINKLKKGVADAKKAVDKFTEGSEKGASQMDKAFEQVGNTMRGALAEGAKVATGAVASITTALVGTSVATQEYRNEQAKLATAFESAGSSAEQAKTTYNDLYRVLGDSGVATEASAHLAKLTQDQQSLSEWTNICQGVYATFGDSIPIEGLTEASNETAKTGQLTGALADALNWAGVNEDKFQESLEKCNSEAEREQLIRETLNGLYSEASATFEQNNADVLAQNEAQAKLTDTLAQLGEAMSPVVTAFTEFANDALSQVTPYIQELAEKYGPTLKEVLTTVGEKLGEVVGYLVDNWGIICAVAGVIGGITAAITLYNIVAAIKTAMAAAEVTTVWALVAAYTAQAAAMIVAIAPYLLIVAAIAAVIAIIILCIKYWDEIVAWVKQAWEKICEVTSKAVDSVVKWFNDMKEKVVAKATELKDKAKEKFEEMKTKIVEKVQEIRQKAIDKFNEIKQGIQDKVTQAKQAVVDKFTEIKTAIQNKVTEAKTAVVDKFTEIKSKIEEKVNQAKTKVEDTFKAVKDAIMNPINEAKGLVETAIETIKGYFDFDWQLPKPKLPHFSVSGGEAPWGFMGKGSLPKIGIDWYAKGGVFDSPTLFSNGGALSGLGENGAEAVVPLENNLGWLDKLAGMLGERLGTGQNIVMQVDGKTFAEVSVNSINQLTKQRGSLPLKLY